MKHRKAGKYWMMHAYAPETKQILAYVYGNRSRKTVQKLYDKLKMYEIQMFCTDNWRAFQEVFPKEKHLIGKQYTREIEGVHTSLRAKNRRFVRKTTCFSKDFAMHDCITKIVIYLRNCEQENKLLKLTKN